MHFTINIRPDQDPERLVMAVQWWAAYIKEFGFPEPEAEVQIYVGPQEEGEAWHQIQDGFSEDMFPYDPAKHPTGSGYAGFISSEAL